MQPITEPDVLAGYLTDASNIPGHADGLFRPSTTEEVAEIVREANRTRTPLTVTAGRTSTTAAAVPMGGWLLSTERLAAIEHIGHDAATAQAGVWLGEFQSAIEATGRFYPPDPTSRHDCTLGASIATNASGARSFKYGPTRRWVEALEVVLADGTVLTADRHTPIPSDWPVPRWTEPSVKTAAGYAPPRTLLDLFVGQEGTLGVITRATVRLTELPAEVLGVVAFFPSRASAIAFVQRARDAQRADPAGALSPRCLEYLDRHCLELARDRVGEVPDAAVAALFCEQEVCVGEEAHLAAWWALLEEVGALADDTLLTTDDAGRENLHAFRHAIPAGINEEVVRNGMPKVGTDLSVPDAGLVEIMDAYDRAPLRHVLFGHIGDNHLHLNLLPTNPEELAQAKAYYDTLAARAVALGGSVSAEHGIGKTKRAHLRTMVGDGVIEQFQRLKSHLDPHWILGRGNVIEPPL
ncbi:MAG: FAD-binding oxidoreductase [Myxococcota bacterium]